MTKLKGFAVGLGLIGVGSLPMVAVAAEQAGNPYFELKAPKITVTEVQDRSEEIASLDGGVAGAEAELAAFEALFDRVVNLGRKAWTLVENNRPVVSFSTEAANALPGGATNWAQLSGWSNPKSYVYRISYENLYGITVVDFSYRVTFTPGGSVNGRGQYLSQVTIHPAQLDVAWGYHFDAQARAVNTVNVGTVQAPVGGIELLLTWTIDTPLKRSENTTSYFVRGDGSFLDLSNGSR